MSGHTPGPWVVADDSGECVVTLAEVNARDVIIANLPRANHANARLIAAAPALLEALREMVLLASHRSGCAGLIRGQECFCQCSHLSKARAAIAAARGT